MGRSFSSMWITDLGDSPLLAVLIVALWHKLWQFVVLLRCASPPCSLPSGAFDFIGWWIGCFFGE